MPVGEGAELVEVVVVVVTRVVVAVDVEAVVAFDVVEVVVVGLEPEAANADWRMGM